MKKLLTLCLVSILSLGVVSAQQEVTLDRGAVTLSATLLMPEGVAKPPVVLIIAGSGPTDRDCNSRLGINTNSYKYFAEDLQKAGVASLRYDKRMIGRSTGTLREEDATFDMLYGDGRFSEVIIAGHSEGSLIGMIVAANNPRVSKFISLAGRMLSFRETLIRQLRDDPDNPEWVFTETERILAALEKGETVQDVRPELFPLFRPSVQPFLISQMKYIPADVIGGLKMPVMIIGGGTDIQIAKEDYDRLSSACPDAAKLWIDDMNHTLKKCGDTTQAAQAAAYTDPRIPNHESLAPAVVEFIRTPARKN